MQAVITVRRGLDCLSLRSDIDMSRGAIVGFSFGAWMRTIVAAVDGHLKRGHPDCWTSRMSEFWRASLNPEVVQVRTGLQPGVMNRYAETTKPHDASEYFRRCSSAPLFFQFGTGDEAISQEDVSELMP